MQGKTCLVTGASAGIGKAAAMGLAALGAQVVLSGRNQEKTAQAAEEVKAKTGNPGVDYLLADFSDLQQVRELAAAFKERYNRLDVLINNAGVYFLRRKDTPYGIEKTFLINHLAPFLLTNLLLDLLLRSSPARILNVTSMAHKYGKPDFDDLHYKSASLGMNFYGRSKLANILFTYELARRLNGSGVTANAIHPGFVDTNLWRRHLPVFGKLLQYLTSRLALTPEQGAEALIYLAAAPEVEGLTGKYFYKRQAVRSSQASYDEAAARHLWKVSERITVASIETDRA